MKVNAVARRIRAYRRRWAEMHDGWTGRPRSWADPAEVARVGALLDAAQAWMDAFLAGRKKGPWAAVARAQPGEVA